MFKLLFIISSVSSVAIPIVFQQCNNKFQVALTFDDGPSNNTDNIIDILNRQNVTATFFINGLHVVRGNMWETMKRLVNSGHVIGTHTFSHVDLLKVNTFNVYRELYDNELVIRQITNKRPSYFRAPYFSYDDNLTNLVSTMFGYTSVVVNLDTSDWSSQDSNLILSVFQDFITSNQQNSFISLQHETITESIDVLEDIIILIKSNNYTIVSLEECINVPPYQNDNVYDPFLMNGINI